MRFSSNCTFFQILEHWAMKLPKATDNYLSTKHHSSNSNLDFGEGVIKWECTDVTLLFSV